MTPREKAELDIKLTEEATATPTSAEVERIHFPDYLIILAKRKWFIFKVAGSAFVLSVVISLLLPKTYTGNAKILPPQQNQSMGAMAALSQLGPLAGLAGQGLGLRSPSDIYVAMLRSDTVANGLIDRFSLLTVNGAKLRVDARHQLADQSEIIAGKDGV